MNKDKTPTLIHAANEKRADLREQITGFQSFNQIHKAVFDMPHTPASLPGNLTHVFYTRPIPVFLAVLGWGLDIITHVLELLDSRPVVCTCQGLMRDGLFSFIIGK